MKNARLTQQFFTSRVVQLESLVALTPERPEYVLANTKHAKVIEHVAFVDV